MIRLTLVASSLCIAAMPLWAEDAPKPIVTPLLSGGETVLVQTITYPEGKANITTAIVTLPVGAQTGWHHHNVSLVGYMLEGALTVDYGEDGEKTYRAGEAVYEAITTSHNGRNNGPDPVRILVVFLGADGQKNTVADQ